jgi:hypothetical protein
MSTALQLDGVVSGVVDAAGTLDRVESHASALSALAAAITTPLASSDSTILYDPHDEGGEQALESHEVVELQAFSRRREWIAEKIKVR